MSGGPPVAGHILERMGNLEAMRDPPVMHGGSGLTSEYSGGDGVLQMMWILPGSGWQAFRR